MKADRPATGIALLCSREGTILSVLRNSLDLDPRALVGRPFTSILYHGSHGKAGMALAEVKALGGSYDWELDVVLEGRIQPLHFSGCTSGDELLIAGTESHNDLARLCDELSEIDRGQAACLRALIETEVLHRNSSLAGETGMFEEITRMNNALANAQRELAKQNREMERLWGAERRHARDMETLYRGAESLLATLDLQKLVQRARAALLSLVPAAEQVILILDPSPVGGALDLVIRERRSLLLSDANVASTLAVAPESDHIRNHRSAVLVPLRMEDQVLGVVAVTATRARALTEADLRLVEVFSTMATAALCNAQLHAEVQRLAVTDQLTGIMNRRGFLDLAERELARALRHGRPLAAIMLDLDLFKDINDRYGHGVGDRVLSEVAVRCRCELRKEDLLGRYGGEEFVVLLPDTDLAGATDAAERLRRAVAEVPVDVADRRIALTISLGVADMQGDCRDLRTLFSRADEALYAAKRAGRNCVRRWQESLPASAGGGEAGNQAQSVA